MAHAAKISELAGALVGSIVAHVDNSSPAEKRRVNQTVASLKDRSHPRTNQFETQAKLAGLIEKFAVLNREDLADALQSKLDQLPEGSAWMPEILSLLLQLSDRPAEHTHPDSFDRLPGDEAAPADLTWDDIVADDPLDDPSLWEDITRGDHSSGDEGTADEDFSDRTDHTQATSVDEDDVAAIARLHVTQPDERVLDDIRNFSAQLQALTQTNNEIGAVSELTLIRETLTMLHGLPTTLFSRAPTTGDFSLIDKCKLSTSAPATIRQAVSRCTRVGDLLNSLRRWVRMTQSLAYLQAIQASLQRSLMAFSAQLAKIERRYLQLQQDQLVSLIEIHTEVAELARPLVHLSGIVSSVSSKPVEVQSPFMLLDALYEEACLAHLSNDDSVFATTALLLCEGIKTYLHPLKAWIEDGQLPNRDADVSPVEEVQEDCELGQVWQRRWKLRTAADGAPLAPAFMLPMVSRAFALGKTTAFMKLLGRSEVSEPHILVSKTARPDLSKLLADAQSASLTPFSHNLEEALSCWLDGTSDGVTPTLPIRLLKAHDLGRSLDALEYVYFSKDGSSFQAFAESLFESRAQFSRMWRDPFVNTELLQDTVGAAGSVDADRLSVQIAASEGRLANSGIAELEQLQIRYYFAWPIQNVTGCSSPAVHSKTLVFLLQTYFAKYHLQLGTFDLRAFNHAASRNSMHLKQLIRFRQKLLCFVDSLHSHLTYTAAWIHADTRCKMEKAESMDDMVSLWRDYERRLATGLLLRDSLAPIRNAVVDVLKLCEQLSQIWTTMTTEGPENGLNSSNTRCTHISHEYDKLLAFITAGLRSASRGSGERVLEGLADRLVWAGG